MIADTFLRAVVIGVGATALGDIWALMLRMVFGQPMPNWGMVGRWVWHLPRKVFHDDIVKAEPFGGERALGWAFHYFVGIVYGIVLIAIVGRNWLEAPTFLPAFILGIVTVGAGWFLLAPGIGAGWAASKTPNPTKSRALNLISHTVFAIGLYGTALLIR